MGETVGAVFVKKEHFFFFFFAVRAVQCTEKKKTPVYVDGTT